jgi:hypothetical protein
VPRDCRWPCRTASHSGGDGLTGGVGKTVSGRDSQVRRGVDSSLTWALAYVSALNSPAGEQVWRRRAREVLERDGTSLEGAFSSRSRQDPARRGIQPPERGGIPLEGRPAPKRGRASPEGATGPRARRSFTSEAPCPSSEAEFGPRLVGPIVWWAVGPWVYLTRVFRFVCVCFLRR